MSGYKCPECGEVMKKVRYGGGRRREFAYLCPEGEKEIYKDVNNHYKRIKGAKHKYRRVWKADELLSRPDLWA